MKKTIVSLTIFSLFFLLGSIYIISNIRTSSSRVDRLIRLHQVEILREHLLIQIKEVQSNLYLKNTPYQKKVDTMIANVKKMDSLSNECFSCHHSEDVLERLVALKLHIRAYKDGISRIFTIRSNINRLNIEKDHAHRLGTKLLSDVHNMIATTRAKLEDKTHSVLEQVTKTKNIIYILAASGPLAIAFFAFIFIRSFAKPIRVLTGATRSFKDGNFDYKITGLKHELGEVAESFNEMAGSLKDQEQIIQMQRTEQMVVLGELSAGMAHEIKNPLAGIKVAMEVISEGSTSKEESKEIISKVIDEIKRIESLLKNLLNFAKPPASQFVLVNIHEILDKSIIFSLKHPSAASKGRQEINILKDFSMGIPETKADPAQLQQVFLNLLLNAIDAMPNGGEISVKTSYDTAANSIRINISDTGKGIDEETINKIFTPFFTSKLRGTGLGLSISKRLIEQHSGTISAKNNPGGGTTFQISIPVEQDTREKK